MIIQGGNTITPQFLSSLAFTAGPTTNDTTPKTCFPFVQNPWAGFVGPQFAAVPLPVTYLSFTAEKQGTAVMLRWQVAEQLNNDRFEVEQSIGGGGYKKIGGVTASAGTKNYEFYHTNPSLDKTNQYRLKQIDKDGRFSYSPIRLVKFSGKNIFTVTPNPATDIVKVFSDQSAFFIHLYEASGRKIKSQLVINGVSELNISSLPKGVYVVIAEKDGVQLEAKQIVKQ